MSRQHIHFANYSSTNNLLNNSTPTPLSGIRYNCEVLLKLDLKKCLEDGHKFYESSNGVILTEGPIPIDYFELKNNIIHLFFFNL